MIILELHGGLGNQMFQYALGRHLSIKNNVPLKLDLTRFGKTNSHIITSVQATAAAAEKNKSLKNRILEKSIKLASQSKKKYESVYSTSHYHTDLKRKYELHHLNIVENILNYQDILLVKLNKSKYKFIEEKESSWYQFESNILNIGANSYIMGFWQSEKYFKDIENVLKEELRVKTVPNEYSRKLLEKITNCNAVSLHVRRGDYVSEKIITEHHGVSSQEYYLNAIKYIKEHVKDPYFFIFSDEPDWAKENIPTGAPTEVSYNPIELGYEDLRLMYNCKHNIIANSSFSWWGGWLNNNSEKIVIAPKQWIANPNLNAKDAVPEEWIRV